MACETEQQASSGTAAAGSRQHAGTSFCRPPAACWPFAQSSRQPGSPAAGTKKNHRWRCRFAARLLAWFLSRVLSASVGFRVAGFNCLRDVTIKFHKGSVESVSIGEIKLSFRKSLVKLSFGFISKDPKLQLLINDLEIVTRSSSQNKKIRKSARLRSTGKGKWLVTSSMARLLSVSVTDLIIKVPKGAVDIKELTVDTLKIAGPNHILGVKLHLLPLNVHFGDLGLTADPIGSCNLLDAFQSDQASVSNSEKNQAPFVCEDLLVTCDFGHEKEKGIKIINLELKCGHVIANIDERLFCKKHTIPEYNTVSSNTGDATMDTSAIKQTSKSKSVLPALKKQMLTFPDKVSFSVPKLDVTFRHLHEGLSVDNNITGIQFTCAKSLPQDDLEEATPHFDVQIDLSEVHLEKALALCWKFLKLSQSLLWMSLWIAEIDAKLGGTQCNVMLSRLMPWMRLHSLRTRGMKLSKRDSNQEISQKKEFEPILWTCTVAAPETAVMLYSINGLALYHACSQSSHLFANNIANKGIQIHTELGELLVHMEEEYREFLKENRFGVDTYSGSLMHIARKFSISYCGDANIVNMPIDDPKRVNYGSQGGQVIVGVSADGTPRRASITSVLPGSNRHLRFSASLVISHLSMCIDKERKTTEAELERVKTIYEELPEDHGSGVRVTLLDMHNAKIVRRSSGRTEVAVCSLFSAADINLRWEPDAHLALYETFIRFKHFLHHNKFQNYEKPINTEVANIKANEHGNMTAGSIKPQKSNRKGSIFAIDVDVLRVSAELADGVEANMHVQSIFTENAKIDIEEEPIQGWLDEHYHLMRNKVCELGVRLKFLDEAISGSVDPNNHNSEKKVLYDGIEVGIHDTTAIQRFQEEIHKQTFRSYYVACQNMIPADGSGACSEGFQAGFKPSLRRASLLSLSASELDVTLTRIDGGELEMVEFIKGLDPVCQEQNIPFSRLYGSDVSVLAGSLVVKLRDYTSPLFSSLSAKCQGRIVLAQQKGEISFGVGYEPSFADISYAFQVALRRVNLSTRASSGPAVQPPKKERSLPWWDDMRYYLHGKIALYFNETKWKFLATTNPYEHVEKLQIVSEYMEIQQTDGHVDVSAKEFKMYISSIDSITKNCRLTRPPGVPGPFIYAPLFSLNVVIDWQCESGNPLNHYLHALPVEGEPRKKVYDPFRSTYLSLRWNFSLRPLQSQCGNGPSSPFYGNNSMLRGTTSGSSCKTADDEFPTMYLGAHDLAWVFKWWSLNYSPPHKLRSFSRWRRFGIPRAARSGNLSLDKVLVEFFFRVDATPCCIRHVTLYPDDPARGLTFKMSNLKYELCYSRGKQQYTFDCKRESLDLVYRGLDLHRPEVYLMRDSNMSSVENVSKVRTTVQHSPGKFVHDRCNMGNFQEKHEDGFLLSSDYFTIRRQTRKADPERLVGWQDTGRSLEITYVRSEFEDDSESDHTLSEPSDDDDDFNVVLADNCQRVFVYGLKILWTLENRDAVWSWVGGISKAFEAPKPSPSRQYAQRKMIEERNSEGFKMVQDASSSTHAGSSSVQHVDASGSSSPLHSKANCSSDKDVKHDIFDDSDKGGTPQYMVNVYTPQFNLHSEEANGRFLLAAASGRVLARSFHSVVHVGNEMLEQALGASSLQILELQPEMTWNKNELSVMLKDVQAHVAPTDVDPGAGLQWLPRILGSSEKLKRTGALLERVFMPCQMYFRYTRHKGGTADLRVKPLKELCFNSPDITATMTSRQFQVMFDVLRNLLLARLPKPRKNSLKYPSDDEDIEEEADEVVPDGVEEVELAKIILEQRDRERKLLLDDIRSLTGNGNNGTDHCDSSEKGDCLWMINSGKTSLVAGLHRDFKNLHTSRKSASSALREALQKAAQLRLTEKEKNKTPSCAMRISMKISKVVWSMLADGNTFAEAEINDMVCDFDRDYKDIGIARFTTKYFVVRNCMANAKCDTLLSAWNTPPGKINMLRVDAKQGAPKDGNSPLELFQVEIYPLRIYLSEAMYRMMWDYFFPEEDDSQRRQLSKFQSIKANMVCGSHQELRRSSSFERTWDESVAESVASNDVVSLMNSSTVSSKGDANNSVSENPVVGTDLWRSKMKDSKPAKSGRLSHEEKKVGKSNDEKKTRTRKQMEFRNIKISQVELLVTYEGSRLAINDLRLLMDTFHKPEFTDPHYHHFIYGQKQLCVLLGFGFSDGKKFSNNRDILEGAVPENEINLSDSDVDHHGRPDQLAASWLKRPGDGAGDGFVTSIRGLFNTQRRKAKAFVIRTMRGDGHNDECHDEWSESDGEYPFARQLTITKAKKLIRRKFRPRGQKNSGIPAMLILWFAT
ncbi:Protein SABRE [Dichanthelium oligosanthes]|uniref:Protein SABRE n=1 Tax=Dichanthelium oligosanthes TaxID=888268 RepID=A0A1E5V065_9POAL|nr:Protein SABRE [Dichanthelium oligosanthes]